MNKIILILAIINLILSLIGIGVILYAVFKRNNIDKK
ncbi:hypothetical protein STRA110950_02115 [Streptobacillus ratti]